MPPFTSHRAESVIAHGELRLIAEIRRWLGDVSPRTPFGIGDDCAVIPPTKNQQLVTTDPVIYGQHFDDSLPPRAVGAKLLKRNLSDIAAMGGRPVAAVVSLALAPDTSGAPMVTASPSPSISTSPSTTAAPGSPSSFSTTSTSPGLTRYCLPPVLITAYIVRAFGTKVMQLQ